MRTRFAVLLPIACCLLLLATACENPATGKPEAQVSEPQPAAEPAAVDGVEFELAPESKIEFVGSKVTGSHDGGFESFDGTIVLAADGPAGSQVDVVIDATSLWADDDRLTGHLKSPDFFDVERFPMARFTSTSIVPTADGYEITGELELHGVTKQITFPASIQVEPDRITARAEFFIQRFDFDIVYPGKPDDLIRDEVVIRLDLVATPK
jgi:polyisoprenoid-binding protein YceI